jgi:hypothetical protein
MYSQAFTVVKDSLMYQTYFNAKAEKEKLRDYSNAFFEKYNISNHKYRISTLLEVDLDAESRKRFADQLCKETTLDGWSVFKKRSATQKAWEQEVISHINMEAITKQNFWWLPFVLKGSYAMWDDKGVLYGMIESSAEIKLEPCMEPIKMSEYYLAMEREES